MNLEPSLDEIAALLDIAKKHILDFIKTIPEQKASRLETDEPTVHSLPTFVTSLPNSPEPFENLLQTVFKDLIPHGVNTMHPGYFGFIPSGGITAAAIAQLVSDTVNRYTTMWKTAPKLAELERTVIRWFGEIMGFKPTTGFLTTGASMATFHALSAARRRHVPDFFLRGTIYVSEQAHDCVRKAARSIGILDDHVRVVPSDAMFRMSIPKLEQMIQHDLAGGLQPFFVVGTAGTTHLGAVDDLECLAEVAQKHQMWFHVDAAYGGFFGLTERGKVRLRGIEQADSIAVDPHKGLCFPYGTGALLCKHETALRTAHLTKGTYIPEDDQEFDICRMSTELTRGSRGLQVWLTLKMLGMDPFRVNLDEKLDMIAWATEELRGIEHVLIVAEPQLTIVAFRLKPPDVHDTKELNNLNKKLLNIINADKSVYLTDATLSDGTLEGMFVLRICALSCRSHDQHIRQCVDIVRRAAKCALVQHRVIEVTRRADDGVLLSPSTNPPLREGFQARLHFIWTKDCMQAAQDETEREAVRQKLMPIAHELSVLHSKAFWASEEPKYWLVSRIMERLPEMPLGILAFDAQSREPVGYALFDRVDEMEILFLDSIGISGGVGTGSRNWQGSGLGTAMLSEALRCLPSRHCAARTQNPAVLKMLRKLNPARVLPIDGPYQGKDRDLLEALRDRTIELQGTSFDLDTGICKGIYAEGKLGKFEVNLADPEVIRFEERLKELDSTWSLDNGDAVILLAVDIRPE